MVDSTVDWGLENSDEAEEKKKPPQASDYLNMLDKQEKDSVSAPSEEESEQTTLEDETASNHAVSPEKIEQWVSEENKEKRKKIILRPEWKFL